MRKNAKGMARIEPTDRAGGAWLMRIQRHKKLHQEYFADSVYGGKEKARKAAHARWLELKEQLPEPITSGVKSVRNTSGVVGVRLAHETRREGGVTLQSYVAFWRDKNKDISVRFGFIKYGKRGAYQRAVIARGLRTRDRDAIERAFKKKHGK
jgi:hypothetical protein